MTSPQATPDVVKQQVRFALTGLSARNGHHEFEHLCRAYACQAISPNILPATGPVSSGGDGGRDFETFLTFRTAGGDRRLVFACTLTQTKDLPQKIRSDVKKIMSGPVDVVFALCSEDLVIDKRNQLIDWASTEHQVTLQILDGTALAEQLATPEMYWIAQQYLALPPRNVLTSLAVSYVPPRPPRAARPLVGRNNELAQCAELLSVREKSRQVVAVTGPPGVGKTEFALALAESVSPHFPDGCYLVEAPTPAAPGDEPDLVDLLAGVLDGGVVRPTETRRQQTARLRSQLAGQRVLIVVDNVTSEQALQDLLSIDDSFVVLCTSRTKLTGLLLDDVVPVELEPLSDEDAASLAAGRAPRLTSEESSSLAAVCGGLPLAVLIAAAQIKSRPNLSVPAYLDRLADPDHGMEMLAAGKCSMAVIIEHSYRGLGVEHTRLVQALGLLPNTTVPLAVIATAIVDENVELTENHLRRAARLLDDLFELNLIGQPEPEGYRLHDVLYRFARTKASDATPGWRNQVVRNGCLAYAARVAVAARSIGFTDQDARIPAHSNRNALLVLEATRVGALAMAELGCRAEQWDRAVTLSYLLVSVLRHLSRWDDLARACRCIQQAGEQTGNQEWIAEALHSLGAAEFHRGNSDEAIALYRRSSEVAHEADDLATSQAAYSSYGQLLLSLGHTGKGIAVLRTTLRVWRVLQQDGMLAQTLGNLGMAYLEDGRLDKAEQYLRNGLKVARRAKLAVLLPTLDTHLAIVLRLSGHETEACEHANDALQRARAIGSPGMEAAALMELGLSYAEVDDNGESIDPLATALRIYRESGDVQGQVIALRIIGIRTRENGELDQAAELLGECVRLATQMGDAAQGARAMAHLARIHGETGQVTDAASMFDEAMEIAESTANDLLIAEVRSQQALLLRNTGYPDKAVTLLRSAVRALSQRGSADILASTQVLLGEALIQNNEWDEAGRVLRPIAEAPAGTVRTVVRATAFRHLAALYSHRNLSDEAEHAARTALDLAKECGATKEAMHCHLTLGNVFGRGTRWAEALEQYDQAAPTAAAQPDMRTVLTLHSNRIVCSRKLGDQDQVIANSRRVAEIAARFGMLDMESGLRLNLGSALAESGAFQEAIAELVKGRELATALGNINQVATAEMNLARVYKSVGDGARALQAARSAREAFQSLGNFSSAAKALGMELLLQSGGDTAALASTLSTLRSADTGIPPALIAAFSSLTNRARPAHRRASDTALRRGRHIHVADSVRELLDGIDVDGLCAPMMDSRRHCFLCRQPIAAVGQAELLAVVSPRSPITVTLAHTGCSPSTVMRCSAPVPELDHRRFDIECALFSETQAGIIVDCIGGQAADMDGRPIDTMLDLLVNVGFTTISSDVTPDSDAEAFRMPALPQGALSAHLVGDQLTVTAGDTLIVGNAPLSFLPRWYRAARSGVLVVLFGRNLQGMTWEDLSYIRHAAETGNLVGAALKLTVTPPGRNSQCVCTPRTFRKYKRCCGQPSSSIGP
ncbi:tetratricopeptide repeat protein [Crossiella sp. SN42]|uniref:tetratricopeptide repeat protein n=1 Tax=Crossiella sp. SN42 TaxID=2944808 RepID=UPI00207C43A2|nr:tetratricopeptide repeat protein [Crossiella sp. SN42]MCO1575617.1 tetratricopeptide repeat protein [Crossiella sp. SN42]